MKLSHGARRCLNVLRTYGVSVFPKQETLARRLLCDIRTVRRYVQELKNAGAVEVRKQGSRSANYYLKSQEVVDKIVLSCYITNPVDNTAVKAVEILCTDVENVRSGQDKLSGRIYRTELSESEQTVAEPSDYEISPSKKNQPAELIASGRQESTSAASISGEVACVGVPCRAPAIRKRPKPECRDQPWNAAIASLASRKLMERGFG